MDIKPGYQTTEWWATLAKIALSTAMALLVLFGKLDQSSADKLSDSVLGVIVAVFSILANTQAVSTYIKSRTELKKAAAIGQPDPKG